MKFLFALLVIELVAPMLVAAQMPVPEIDVSRRCQQERQFECLGRCKDGWSTTCYYDSQAQEIKPNVALEIQKDRCFGFYDVSQCDPCKDIRWIREGSDVRKVSCNEFYVAIIKKNKECGGCLKVANLAGG